MRHITTFSTLIILLFFQSATAQQWESFLSPPFPLQNSKLVALEGNLFAFVSTGLYRSQDGGEHWTQIRSYTSDNVAQVLEINRNNKCLYWSEGLDTMGFYQLFSSADLGNSWQAIGNVQAGVSAFIGDTIYGSAYGGAGHDIARKLGAGPWAALPNWQGDTTGGIHSMSAEGTHLWVATLKGVYHSPDAGYTWEHSLPLYDLEVTYHSNNLPTSQVQALNGEVVLTDEIKKRLFFSKDAGASWQEAPWDGLGLYHTGHNLYATDPTGALLRRFGGGSPSNWQDLPVGASGNLRLSGVGENDGTLWLGSLRFGVARKKPDAPRWELVNGVPITGGSAFRYQDGYLFLDNVAQTFSNDNGASWEQTLTEIYPDSRVTGNHHRMLASDGTSSVLLRCPRNGRFEWETYSKLPGFARGMITLGDTLICQSSNAPYQLYFSYDAGATWANPLPVPPAFGNVNIREARGKLYAIKDKTMHRSDDLGATWQPVFDFPYTVDESIGRFFVAGDTLLLSHPPLNLIFYSADNGQSFDTLPAPQNFNTTAYRLRVRQGLLLLHLDEELFYISRNAGSNWTSVAMPPGMLVQQLATHIGNDLWTYGDNTLFLPDNWRLRLDDQRQASGKVFLDANSNGQQDVGETGLNQLVVKAAQSGVLSATYNGGAFSMLLGQQADMLSVANVPPNYAAAPGSVTVVNGTGSIPPTLFAIQPQGTVNDASVNLAAASQFRAGYDNTLYIHVKNAGTVASNGQVKLVLNPLLNLVAATPAADAVVGDTIYWNYANLQPLKGRYFEVRVGTAVVPPGTPLVVRAETFNNQDVAPANNVSLIETQIVSSYDPNDKAVSDTEIPVSEADNSELAYTIRFQNLGNIETDFITIRDTLSETLDAASVRMLASSHPCEWRIEDGRVLIFRFNPIRLTPASEDSLGSQGFVQFSVRLASGLEVGAEIANTAYIYFDFNPAIVTNTVLTGIGAVATFEPAQQALPLELFPNPSDGRFTLRLPEGISGTGRIEMFSPEGRVVYATVAQAPIQSLDLPGLAPGTYWCRWTAAGKTFWGKVMVVK